MILACSVHTTILSGDIERRHLAKMRQCNGVKFERISSQPKLLKLHARFAGHILYDFVQNMLNGSPRSSGSDNPIHPGSRHS
jgi:hypothetical protein